jgi:hemoglobin-like flavoprotein
MSPENKTLVKSTWAMVVPIADVAATLFYQRLFLLDPSLRPMFEKTDMTEQRRKLMAALVAVVNGLDNLDPLIPVLENLGRNHVRYGVTDQHYDTVGAALLWTLEQGLKDAWVPAVKIAWTTAYGAVAGVMRNAAATSHAPALA